MTSKNDLKVFNFGEESSGIKSKCVQDYATIYEECLKNDKLFVDESFKPHDLSNLCESNDPVKWLRPFQIVTNPSFCEKSFCSLDIEQGVLGDCWVLSAIISLTLNKEYFEWIVPMNQNFGEKYVGLFHFRLWIYGKWVDIVIDDMLPTQNGRLIFTRSENISDFWIPLLEKAYAKSRGSFANLDGGLASEAMVDFTGGVTELFDIPMFSDQQLMKVIMMGFERNSLMSVSFEGNKQDTVIKQGVYSDHAYALISFVYIKRYNLYLFKVQNPWGHSGFTGRWSENSSEWNSLTVKERQDLQLKEKEDGVFYISFEDFAKIFKLLEVCNLTPLSLHKNETFKAWHILQYDGEWVTDVSAGGSRQFETHFRNPYFVFKLEEMSTVIINLMQKHCNILRKVDPDHKEIGFSLYKIKERNAVTYLALKRFADYVPGPRYHLPERETTFRYEIGKGRYVIVPSVREAQEEGRFLLRIFSNNNINSEDEGIVKKINIDWHIRATMDSEKIKNITDKYVKDFKDYLSEEKVSDWLLLKDILHQRFEQLGLDDKTYKKIAISFSFDKTGTLSEEDFCRILNKLLILMEAFNALKTLHTNYVSGYHLKDLFRAAGYSVNVNVCNIMGRIYLSDAGNIYFKEFVECTLKLDSILKIENCYECSHISAMLAEFL